MKNILLLLILFTNQSFAISYSSSALPSPTAAPTIVPPPSPTPTGGVGGTTVLQNYTPADASINAVAATGLNTVAANPELWPCIHANPIAAGATRPASEYDCTPTPRDAGGKLTGSLTNYQNWNSVLYKQNSTTPVNGFYSKNGVRCTTSVATNACPIAVKVQFVYNCDTTETMMNGKCVKAKSLEIYHAIYQSINIVGEAPIKPIIVGDSNVDPRAISATPVSSSALTGMVYNEFKCSSLTPTGVPAYIQLGEDKYGAPICGQDPNQGTIDAMQTKLCDIETTQVNTYGGTTTTCNPNITVTIKIVGGNHLAKDCTGTLVDLGGYPVSAPIVANSLKVFCKYNGSSCPSGWTPHSGWSSTSRGYCDASGGNIYNPDCPSWNQTTEAQSRGYTGEHGWSDNSNIESLTTYSNATRRGYSDCGCVNCCCIQNQIGGYANCSATRTSIGCK